MTYRLALGPAGLRLEIPALIDGVARRFGVDEARILDWSARHAGLDKDVFHETQESAVPISFIQAEIEAAVGPSRRFQYILDWSSSASRVSSTSIGDTLSIWRKPAARRTRPGL